MEYSPGRPSKKPYLDYVLDHGRTVTRNSLKYLNAYEKHKLFLQWRTKPADGDPHTEIQNNTTAPKKLLKSDYMILAEQHKFLRTESDDDGSWESRLAQKYYNRLSKEYVICDLSRYRKGEVGLRWRSEADVVTGIGQFTCSNKRCPKHKHRVFLPKSSGDCKSAFEVQQSAVSLQSIPLLQSNDNTTRSIHAEQDTTSHEGSSDLKSYEVHFKYIEDEVQKDALVKARLCNSCAYKLYYRQMKKRNKPHLTEEHNDEELKHAKRTKLLETTGSSDVKTHTKHIQKSQTSVEIVTSTDTSETSRDGDCIQRHDTDEDRHEAKSPTHMASVDDVSLTSEDVKKLESLAWKASTDITKPTTERDDLDDYLSGLFN